MSDPTNPRHDDNPHDDLDDAEAALDSGDADALEEATPDDLLAPEEDLLGGWLPDPEPNAGPAPAP